MTPKPLPIVNKKPAHSENPPKAATMNDELSHAFSRKTDTTELQKPPNCNFFYPFIYNDLRHFLPKKIPRIPRKSAGPSKYEGGPTPPAHI